MIQIKLKNNSFEIIRVLNLGLNSNEELGNKIGVDNFYELMLNSNILLARGRGNSNLILESPPLLFTNNERRLKC